MSDRTDETPDDPQAREIEFHGFCFDPATLELSRAGTRLPLAPKPALILGRLLDTPGELVTREELYDVGWPDCHVEREMALNSAIREVRRAVGDRADRQQIIETLPKRGYRLLEAKSSTSTSRTTAAAVRSSHESRERVPLRAVARRWLLAACCSAGLILSVGLGLLFARPVATVQVQPLEVADSVRDGDRGALLEARLRNAIVAAGQSRVKLLVAEPEADTADEAEYLVSGRLHAADSRDEALVTIQIVRVADRSVVWGGAFNPYCTEIDDPTRFIASYVARLLLQRS